MSFDARDLRRGKDVFGADGTYLGTVVWVRAGRTEGAGPYARPHDPAGRPRASGDSAGSPSDAGPAFSGEALGPMPTAALGNGGPGRQSMAAAYATSYPGPASDPAQHPTELVVLRLLTSLDWSTLRPRVWRIPVGLVQAVSHERIVLSVTPTELR